MRKEESKEIDGHVYLIRMIDPDLAWDTGIELFDTLGPALSALVMGDGPGTDEDEDEDEDSGSEALIAKAVLGLVGRIDKKQSKNMLHMLAKHTDVDGVPLEPQYKAHFMGQMGWLVKWLIFAIQVQYRDFFDAFAGTLTSQMRPSPSQQKQGAQ